MSKKIKYTLFLFIIVFIFIPIITILGFIGYDSYLSNSCNTATPKFQSIGVGKFYPFPDSDSRLGIKITAVKSPTNYTVYNSGGYGYNHCAIVQNIEYFYELDGKRIFSSGQASGLNTNYLNIQKADIVFGVKNISQQEIYNFEDRLNNYINRKSRTYNETKIFYNTILDNKVSSVPDFYWKNIESDKLFVLNKNKLYLISLQYNWLPASLDLKEIDLGAIKSENEGKQLALKYIWQTNSGKKGETELCFKLNQTSDDNVKTDMLGDSLDNDYFAVDYDLCSANIEIKDIIEKN